MNFSVLPKITGYQPERIDTAFLETEFELADPDIGNGNQIDLLLGSEFYHEFLQPRNNGTVMIRNPVGGLPAFIDSVFGWLATGKGKREDPNSHSVPQSIMHVGVSSSLDDLIAKFWELEQIPEAIKWTLEEQECEAKFQQQYQRDHTGRYIVKLPYKLSGRSLGESKSSALKRFHHLEGRFDRDSKLKEMYSAVIDEYILRGYLKKVSSTSEVRMECFLPHHLY